MNIEEPAQIIADPNSQPEFDTSAAIAEISTDLFGQEGKVDTPVEEGEVPADVAAVEPPPTEEVAEGEENSAEVQELGAPATWTKEALAEWAAVPPRVKEEILKREDDMMRGLGQYKAAADIGQKYEAVVEPYRAMLTAEGIDPVQLFNSFSANHYLLSRGTAEQKVEIAANMLGHYGVEVKDLIDYLGDQILNPVDPRVARLEQELAGLKTSITQQSTQSSEAQQAAALTEIEEFAKNPAHLYFNEVVADVAKFMETGVAATLSEAYEKAVFANPVTRQKELERLTAAKQSEAEAAEKARKDKQVKLQAANVNAQPHQRDGTIPLGSMDDTLESTLAAIQGRA